MNSITDEKYLMERNKEFSRKCLDIFKKNAPDMDIRTLAAIIPEIALVRSKMELEYSLLLTAEIQQTIMEELEKR